MADNTEVLLLKVQAIVEGQANLVALANDLKQLESSQVAAAKAQAAATENLSRQLGQFAAQQAHVAAQTQQLSQTRLAAAERLIGISNQQTALLHQEAAATAQLTQQVAALPAKQIAAATSTAAFGTSLIAVDVIAERVTQTLELFSNIVEGVVDQGFETDRYRQQFAILEGSVEGAKHRLEEIEQFALTYNLDFPQVIEAARQLEAVGIKDQRTLLAIADAAKVTGRDLKDVAQALVSVSRGEIRPLLQFIPAPSSQLLAAQEQIERSARKSPEALRFYTQQAVDELLKQYGGGLERAAELTESKLGGIRNRFAQFRQEIFDSGVGDAVDKVVEQILLELEVLERDGTLSEWAALIGQSTRVAAEGMSVVIRLAPTLARVVQFGAAAGSVAALGLAVTGLIALGPEVAAFFALVRTAGLVGAMDAATVGAGAFRTGMLGLVSPLGITAVAIGATTVALNLLADAAAKPFVLHLSFDSSREEIIAELERLERHRDELAGKRVAVATGIGIGIGQGFGLGNLIAGKGLGFDRKEAEDEAARQQAERLLNARIGSPAPPLKSAAQPPPGADPDAKRAFDAAIRDANKLLSETERVSKAATDIVVEEIEKRLDASGAEGEARLRLLTQYAASEQSLLLQSGALRERLETELAERVAQRRAEIAATGSSEAVQRRLNADLDAESAASQRAIDIAFTTGRAESAVRKGVAEETAKERIEIERKLSRDRAKLAVEDAQFERDLFGQTAEQYATSLRRRLADLNQYSLAAKAIAEELARAQKAADEESLARVTRSAAARRAGESVGEAGVRIQAGDRVRQNTDERDHAEQDNLDADYAARVDYYARLLGVHHETFAEMTIFEREQYGLALEAASSFYGALRTGAAGTYKYISDQVKKTIGTEQGRFELVRFLTQKGSKEAIAAAAEQAQGELKVRAIVWAAEAIAAAAFGQFDKATRLAEAAGLAGVGVAVTGAIARSERASIADDERQRSAVASEPAAGATRGGGDTRLAISQGNQPITLNVYNSVSFEGGTIFLDRAGARMITDMLSDSINEAIESGKIKVR